MKRLVPTLALLTLAAASACTTPAPTAVMTLGKQSAASDRSVATVGGHRRCVIVKCADDATAQRVASDCGGRWVRRCRGTALHVIDIGALDAADALARCRAHPGVDYAEEDADVVTAGGAVRALSLATDAAPLARLHADKAWAVTRGAGMTIAVLDTGIDANHPGLAGRVKATANFSVESIASMDDRHGHGTFMAGVLAGAPGGPGGGGVAPEADLLVGKVLEDDGEGVTSAVTDGIVWAANSGADVILLGLVARKPTQALQDAVDFAWSQGAVVVCAAGNDGNWVPNQPASYAHSMAVSAVDPRSLLARFASWGTNWVDVSAPGVGVGGLMPTGANVLGYSGQAAMDGSSIAAAFVAGEAALIKAANPTFTNADVRDRIEGTSARMSLIQLLQFRKGVIDLGRAIAP